MNEDLQALQFVSNVIELKPDKKYLLVFHGVNPHMLGRVDSELRERGFHSLSIATYGDQKLQVIEAPATESPGKFWEELGKALTINERRAVFAKLSELIGVSVNEYGEVETNGEVKHQWSLEEAKAFVGPH